MSKPKKKALPKVHPELEGLSVEVNEFGEIVTNFPIEKINKFLDEYVDDKKLKTDIENKTKKEEKN